MSKKEDIDYVLNDYPYLRCNSVYERDINFILDVINLPYWQNPKYRNLLTTSIWKTNLEDINNILLMDEWNRSEYQKLLTPCIWSSNYQEVKKILNIPKINEGKYNYLLTSNIWNTNSSNIINILDMKLWDDPKYRRLLTPNIWVNNYDDIVKILNMEEWQKDNEYLLTSNIWKSNYNNIKMILNLDILKDDKYKHLLVPSIFNIRGKNIIPTIDLLKEYNIDKYITNRCLRRNVNLTKALILYMLENNIPLLVNSRYNEIKLNKMLNDSNSVLKSDYNINLVRTRKENIHGK